MQDSVPLSYKAELIARGAVRHEWDMGPRLYGEVSTVEGLTNWLTQSVPLSQITG